MSVSTPVPLSATALRNELEELDRTILTCQARARRVKWLLAQIASTALQAPDAEPVLATMSKVRGLYHF